MANELTGEFISAQDDHNQKIADYTDYYGNLGSFQSSATEVMGGQSVSMDGTSDPYNALFLGKGKGQDVFKALTAHAVAEYIPGGDIIPDLTTIGETLSGGGHHWVLGGDTTPTMEGDTLSAKTSVHWKEHSHGILGKTHSRYSFFSAPIATRNADGSWSKVAGEPITRSGAGNVPGDISTPAGESSATLAAATKSQYETHLIKKRIDIAAAKLHMDTIGKTLGALEENQRNMAKREEAQSEKAEFFEDGYTVLYSHHFGEGKLNHEALETFGTTQEGSL